MRQPHPTRVIGSHHVKFHHGGRVLADSFGDVQTIAVHLGIPQWFVLVPPHVRRPVRIPNRHADAGLFRGRTAGQRFDQFFQFQKFDLQS